jgi:hypothetical protein
MLRITLVMLGLLVVVSGCATSRETSPSRTATEQLLISTAADRAARDLALKVPDGAHVFIDDRYFEGFDSKYAIGALREELLKTGARLVADRPQADVVVEIRAGALSIDEEKTLVGIPQIDVPIPLAGALGLPELALYKEDVRRGVAKLAAVAYDANTGALIAASEPQYGYSHRTEWVVMLIFAWTTSDLVPVEEQDTAANDFVPDVYEWADRPGDRATTASSARITGEP